MKARYTLLSALLALVVLAVMLAACGTPATPAAPQVIKETVVVEKQVEKQVVQTQVVEKQVEKQVVVTATPGPNPEALITGVEPNAEITLWTFWLSPTFDDYIKSTITRFNQAYPGVKVKWEDHQATFRQDLDNAFNAKSAPDVINLSVSEGWVSDYATRGLLLPLDKVDPKIVATYFPGLWKEQLVNGVNYQFPWYQGIGVDLINTKIYSGDAVFDKDGKVTGYTGGAGLKVEDFPKKIEDLPALCKTIKDKTNTLCDIRLTMSDLLSQMVYEGGVKVISDDGKKFTFDSPEGVSWLQMYVDMVKAGTVDKTVLVTTDDRVGLNLFTSGRAAFYATGPNLIREVRANNPALYGYLAAVQAPVGKSGVAGKGLMSLSIKKDSKFPNASMALAQFFTNAKSMLEFAKVVAVYPSTPASYDDPFFSAKPVAVEDSAKPIAKDIVGKLADIVPTIPKQKDVNEFVSQAIQQALFNGVPAQKALTDAVTKANALIAQ